MTVSELQKILRQAMANGKGDNPVKISGGMPDKKLDIHFIVNHPSNTTIWAIDNTEERLER